MTQWLSLLRLRNETATQIPRSLRSLGMTLAMLFLFGCMIRWPTAERAARYLALGDSYTIGEAVPQSESFPAQLTPLLRARGVYIDDPLIIAQTGWTTDELSAGIDAREPVGPFDLVTLLIGVNNQYRGRSAEEYRQQFGSLLQRAIIFAGGKPSRVIVLSIPDWGITPFAEKRDRTRIGQEIDQFNAINREEAARAGVRYVDVTAVSRQAGSDSSLLAADRLHPSAKMYAEWARLVLPVALDALK